MNDSPGKPEASRTYACFAWIALVPWIEPVTSIVPGGLGGMILTVLSVPIVLGTLAAGGLALTDSWRRRGEVTLVLMSTITLVMFGLVVAADGFGWIAYETASWGTRAASLVLGGVVAYGWLRRRSNAEPMPGPD